MTNYLEQHRLLQPSFVKSPYFFLQVLPFFANVYFPLPCKQSQVYHICLGHGLAELEGA